jgi:hypothetical protein
MTVEMITLAAQTSDAASMPLVTDIQYLEPFTSTSLNRKFCGIVRAGVFRGFACFPGDGLTLDISNTQNQTGESVSFGVALVERDDYLLTVRQQKPISLSIPAGQVSYVVLEAFFEHGVTTSQVDSDSDIEAASIKVLTEAQVQEHHVILCVADVPAGATELTNAHLNFDERELGGYDLESHLTDVHPHKQYVRNDADSFVEGDVTLGDNFEWSVGDARDLTLYHDGTNSFVENETGNLIVRQQAVNGLVDFQVDNGSGGLASIMKLQGGAEPSVKLFNGSNVRLTTTQAGVLVSGEIQTTGEIYENNQRVFSPNNRNISDSVTSTSSTVYASSNAAKRAHDRAVLAESNSKTHADNLYNQLLGDAPQEALDTLTELAAQLNDDANAINAINNTLATKADKATSVSVSGAITGGGTLGANFSIGVRTATTSQTGVIQLSNSVASTSSAYAATPYAVKQAYDLANSKLDAGANAVSASKWYTARALTIGNATKSVDGSKGVSWSLAEIGAVNRAGDAMAGDLDFGLNQAQFGSGAFIVKSANLGDGVVGGSDTALNIRGPSNGHVTIAIAANDAEDAFNVISFVGAATDNHDFTRRAFWVKGQGHTYAAGNMYVNSSQRVYADNYHPVADALTTARTIRVGEASKLFDGSGDLSWTLAEIGAAPVQGRVVNDYNSYRESGFYGVNYVGSNAPSKNSFGSLIVAQNKDTGLQIAGGHNNNMLAFRGWSNTGGTWQSWKNLYHDAYHPNADKWTTARILSLSGDVTGSVSIDGSSNVTLSTVVADNSHNHTSLGGITKLRFGPGVSANDDAAIEWLGASNAGYLRFSTADDNGTEYMQFGDYDTTSQGGAFTQWLKMYRGQAQFTGNVSASTFTGALSGNASTASKWATGRAIKIGNTSKTVDGSGDLSWSLSEIGAAPVQGRVVTDYNNFRDSGFYGVSGTGSNAPSNNFYGSLIVARNSDTGLQIAGGHGNNMLAFRGWSNTGGSWQSWKNLFHDAYHPNADKLTTARTINGTSFDGTANITTSSWGTARTLTIGNTARPVNGSSNVSWSLAEIGAAPSGYGLGTYGRSLPSSILGNTALRRESGFWQGSSITGLPTYGHTWKYLWTQAHPNSNGYWGYIGIDFDCTAAFFGGQSAGADKTAIRLFADNYHPNADKWTTARTLTLSGDASGSVSWDGSANATLSVTVNNDSHTHDTRYLKLTGGAINGDLALSDGKKLYVGDARSWLTAAGAHASFESIGNIKIKADNDNASPTEYLTLAAGLNSLTVQGGSQNTASALKFNGSTVLNTSNYSTHLDGRYFTESESNSRFAYKAGSGSQDFNTRRIITNGTGNDYNGGGIEVKGNGRTNTVYPTVGFHQSGLYAGSLQMRAGGDFRFYAQGGSSYGVVRAATFYGALSGNASTATWADTVDVNSGNTSESWYDIVWHSGDTVYSSTGVEIQGSTNSIKSNRHYFAGTAYYLREATGNYGTVATYGRKSGWGGYSIEGRAVLMHDGSTKTGIYNDVDNEWLFLATHNAGAVLYYNGSSKFETTSGGVSVTGSVSASGSVNDSSGRVYSPGNKPSKADVGLSNVANYGVTSSVSSTSTSHFATAKAVKTAYDKAVAATGNSVYSGSSSTNTSFPIGTTVAVNSRYSGSRAASETISYRTDTAYSFGVYSQNGGVALTGTWRQRGHIANGNMTLWQRVA